MTPVDGLFATRTLQALELVAFQPASAPEIAGALRIDPRTARRLLNRLVVDGWLDSSGARNRIYWPTRRILALAAQFAQRDPLVVAARPVVQAVHDETGLVSHLAIPSYRSALCLVHSTGRTDARPVLRELVPAHATAAGKVLLAYRDSWREDLLARPLERCAERTVTDADAVRGEARVTRARGYALEDGELAVDLRAVAVPVSERSAVVAALAVSGRGDDVPVKLLSELAIELRVRAREIEDRRER